MIVKFRKAHQSNWTGLKSFNGGVTVLGAARDIRTGNIVTGLTSEEAIKIETELNYPHGTLAYNSPFWESYKIRIPNAIAEFDTDLMEDLLKYKVLAVQKKIATSLEEVNTNAYAEYVMYSDDEEARTQNIKFDVRVEAYSELAKLYSSLEDMRNVLSQYGKRADTISLDVAKSILVKEVELDPKRFLGIIKDPDFKNKIFISDLIKTSLLGKKGSAFTYDGEVISYSMEDMVNFLKKKENSNVVLAMKSQLKEKKK